jgi:hypothetical protein
VAFVTRLHFFPALTHQPAGHEQLLGESAAFAERRRHYADFYLSPGGYEAKLLRAELQRCHSGGCCASCGKREQDQSPHDVSFPHFDFCSFILRTSSGNCRAVVPRPKSRDLRRMSGPHSSDVSAGCSGSSSECATEVALEALSAVCFPHRGPRVELVATRPIHKPRVSAQ